MKNIFQVFLAYTCIFKESKLREKSKKKNKLYYLIFLHQNKPSDSHKKYSEKDHTVIIPVHLGFMQVCSF